MKKKDEFIHLLEKKNSRGWHPPRTPFVCEPLRLFFNMESWGYQESEKECCLTPHLMIFPDQFPFV